MIVANEKFVVQENELNGYKFQLVLVIKKLEKVVDQFCNNRYNGCQKWSLYQGDFGTYRCISKNSIGQAEEVVELYGKLKDQKYLRHISCSIPWPVERSEASLQTLNPSPPPPEMPSKIPTYSVFPNSDPDTEYEEDYETPAPGPPPTRSFALYTS